jgi:molybdopterin-guanine dinucleotide biosynthesis protein A
MTLPVVGILVGGQGRRMGGVAKGLLEHEGRPLVDRLVDAVRRAVAPEPLPATYLVGNAAAYVATRLPVLADDPIGRGPIGGLRALLIEAKRSERDAIALAVDLPYVTAALIRRLCFEHVGAAALAPREAGRWQPLFARYRPQPTLAAIEIALAAGRSSIQSIFEILDTGVDRSAELVLDADEKQRIRDWDRPSDMDGNVPPDEP